ncbi:rhomboid family protein [Fimbriiglobus ruber]|uniref:Rhomboid family serine protease n=1 Tax=Fimbriiglobus ruber TaxID=1908690 RepID=A0A225DHY3_9BACT|nr:rhomboid family intramembrane serine protease [Fimbriiglobus ruber]OWK36809.1 rhomboid family serine protease [Fimbriiglobus ruber]
MGIYSRDYYRESTPEPWSFSGASAVKYIIIANVVVFLIQILVVRQPSLSEQEEAASRMADQDQPLTERQMRDLRRSMFPEPIVQEWLELDTNKVVGGQVWRLLTHAFCHDRHGIFHILFNMLFLFWFGRTLEMMYGSREFLLFYLAAAVFAALAFVGLDLYTGSSIPAVGASGAVMAVLMLYTMHFPRETIYVCWFIPLEMRWLMALYLIYDLHPVLLALAGDPMHTGIAHAAHLGGLAFGFLYARYQWRLERVGEWLPFAGWCVNTRRARPAPRRRFEPDPDTERVDQVLEKISVSGQDSLTAEERAILQAASERLKSRARGR